MEDPQWETNNMQSKVGSKIEDYLNNGGKNANAIEEETIIKMQNSKRDENPIISDKVKQLISIILDQMKELSHSEKYYVYLKLFQASNVVDPLRQPLNPLGSRSEINRTISWIKTHLEEDPETSLPKQHVYEEYSNFCTHNQIKSLSQADFGKVMKQVYPKVRARRLGTRGNSRYCYSGLRRCIKLKTPSLPDLADKTLSTEAPCTLSGLTTAAWMIIKEWTKCHFKVDFPSLQSFAKFLVLDHSVGCGGEAAQLLTGASDLELKNAFCTICPAKTGFRSRDKQLPNPRKAAVKNETKEKKRKTTQQKSSAKKSKLDVGAAELSPTESSSTSYNTSSTSTSPTQGGKPVCDKSLDFTELPALPDFKSFRKLVPEAAAPPPPSAPQQQKSPPKVAIPRLLNNCAKNQQRSPHGQAATNNNKKPAKNTKYKNIQPKPQSCDISSYNPQNHSAEIRSQVVADNIDRLKGKEKKCNEDEDPSSFILPRERLNSISSVDKDAMDEYLGTNNSQHEEELSKYFNGSIEPSVEQDNNNTKLVKLRQLLEQHGISDNNKNECLVSIINNPSVESISTAPLLANGGVLNHDHPAILNNNIKRRVSFDTALQDSESIPQSPNTRRKNFSFTPISPGPHSPSGRQSKCSSTNVSPFVSPRNTPVFRGAKKTLKKEPELTLDIPEDDRKLHSNAVMSAPTSPMLKPSNNKSVLHKLLKSNSKVSYNPNYMHSSSYIDQSHISKEIEELLLQKENTGMISELCYRSQSVPLNQMIKSNLDIFPVTFDQNLANSDFNDFDEQVTETVTVKKIIDSLDQNRIEEDSSCDVFTGLNMSQQTLPGFNQISNNNLGVPAEFNPAEYISTCARALNRSQSIDFSYNYGNKNFNNPSRSVPSTPLPFEHLKIKHENAAVVPDGKAFGPSSRSYPSTPSLTVANQTFIYSVNGDCLLNGQPIKTSTSSVRSSTADDLHSFIGDLNEINDNNVRDDNRRISCEDDFKVMSTSDFTMVVDNDNTTLVGANDLLISDASFANQVN